MRNRNLILITCTATLLAYAACTTSTGDTKPDHTQEDTVKKKPQVAQVAQDSGSVSFDESMPSGQHAAWILDVLNTKKGKVSKDDIQARFHSNFLAQASAEHMIQVFAQMSSQLAPLSVVKVEQQDKETAVLWLKSTQGSGMIMYLKLNKVSMGEKHLIEGLLFKPADLTPAKPLSSWKEIDESLKVAAESAQIFVAKINAATGACTPVHALEGEKHLAIGSTFKLYVLGALAIEAKNKSLTWGDTFAIKEDLKSLPSGQMQNEVAGKEFPLEHYAAKMISISDNTATDHLFARIGRAKVEEALVALGHKEPGKTKPMMSTREMFLLKVGPDYPKSLEAFAAGNEKTRRDMLKSLKSAKLPSIQEIQKTMKWDVPRAIDKVEWFASAQDLCNAHGWFAKHEQETAINPALKILAINTGGIDLNKETWSYVGFKGGSEPGVLNLSYVIKRKRDGQWFSITVGLNDTKKAIPMGAHSAMLAIQSAAKLLEK